MLSIDEKYDEWINSVSSIVLDRAGQSHGSNLLTKLSKREASENKLAAFSAIVPAYIAFNTTNVVDEQGTVLFTNIVAKLNAYLALLNSPECDIFRHQSDFKSSVIPEFFFVVIQKINHDLSMPYTVISQKDIAIELMFDTSGNIAAKRKRMDLAVLKPCALLCNGMDCPDFAVPIVASEIKTNLDKNMLAGIEFSVESLKRTFPKCLYFVITELADMAYEHQNYAATGIDEIFVLRKQKRSNVRRGQPRNNVDCELIKQILEECVTAMRLGLTETVSLHDRMARGKLIREEIDNVY